MKSIAIDNTELDKALRKKLGEDALAIEFQVERLHGGTIGDVLLVSGKAEIGGSEEPFCMVYKHQKKWSRYADPLSWRREYDLYDALPDDVFTDNLRRPACYHKNISDGEMWLWMEFAECVSGLDMTPEMYELAARELGRFQGRLHAGGYAGLKLTNVSSPDYIKQNYLHERSTDELYHYIRDGGCSLPRHLCKMIIDIDERCDEIFCRIERLPLIFCHRDFWVTNIFCSGKKVMLVDWDTAGWGYLGEDIASLVADDSDIDNMVENFTRCVKAYYEGFSEFAEAPDISENCIYEMMLIKFSYRLVGRYKNPYYGKCSEDAERTLQKIYEIGHIRL